jgi:hypothetical protein
MAGLRRRFARVLFCAVAVGASWPAGASDSAFPFDRELMLDASPMRGSKRVPIIEVSQNGAASIDLWCASARAAVNVGDGSITIVPGEVQQPAQCAPERQSSDESLLAALAQVTNWRRRGDVIEFVGATTLRFRLMTN